MRRPNDGISCRRNRRFRQPQFSSGILNLADKAGREARDKVVNHDLAIAAVVEHALDRGHVSALSTCSQTSSGSWRSSGASLISSLLADNLLGLPHSTCAFAWGRGKQPAHNPRDLRADVAPRDPTEIGEERVHL